jgi:hypothetical protein
VQHDPRTDVEGTVQGRSNYESTAIDTAETDRIDYFHFVHTVTATEDMLVLGEVKDDKKDAIVSVTIASDVLTPPTSPDELDIVGTD